MATKTIGRNRKALIANIFDNAAADGQSFSLSNGFSGKSVSIGWIRAEFDTFRFAKLSKIDDVRYHVTLHGNQWYEFTVPPAVNS